MNTEFKGTKGELSHSKQKGTIGHCHAAQVWDSEGNSLAVIRSTSNEAEASSYAELFAAAPVTLEALQFALKILERDKDPIFSRRLAITKSKSAINKALGNENKD